MLSRSVNQDARMSSDDERNCIIIKESPGVSQVAGKMSSVHQSKLLGEEDSKESVYTGGKYVVSKNIEFFCKVVTDMTSLSSTVLFIPKKDCLLVCTHNNSTSLFCRLTFTKEFFAEVDASCLRDGNFECCISKEIAYSIFKIDSDVIENLKYLTLDVDPTKDFINVILYGPIGTTEFIRVNQLNFTNPLENYSFLEGNGEFRIVCHVDVWKLIFNRFLNCDAELILQLKKNSVVARLRKRDTGLMLKFSAEIPSQSFIQYNINTEFNLSFNYSEFLMSCNIVSRLTKKFSLEYIGGEAPLRMSLYQPNLVDFVIFFPCKNDPQ